MHLRNASTHRRYFATRCQRPCHDSCPNQDQGAVCPTNVALRPDLAPRCAHTFPICRCMLSLWAMASSGCMWTAWPSHSKTDETSPTTSASTGQTSPGRACNGIRPSQPCFAYDHHHPLWFLFPAAVALDKVSRTYPVLQTDDCVLGCILVKSSQPAPLDPDDPCLPPSPDPQPGLSLILASTAKRSAADTRLTRSTTSSP